MNKISAARTTIDGLHQSSISMQSHFSAAAREDDYAAYRTSMYLIQDTAESVSTICGASFSDDPLRAYVELWGTLQAVFVQQDAIVELNRVITGQSIQPTAAWQEIRKLRHELAGHPVAQGNKSAPKRSFLGRDFGTLDNITYEQYQLGSNPNGPLPNIKQQSIDLGALIDRYDNEAAAVLDSVAAHMKKTWP